MRLFLFLLLAIAHEPRVVNVIADSDDRFKVPGQSGNVLTVKPGEKLILHVDAKPGAAKAHDGAVHSLVVRQLRDQGWDVRLKEGTQDVALTAPAQPGDYTIECTVFCGPGHTSMNMKMVVKN
jgi:heme/copper-type cytochrome/quinol oxidase subunit 2